MDKGVLGIKMMILGAVLFLAGWEFLYNNGVLPLVALMVGIAFMAAGLLMGNRKKENDGNDAR